MKLFSLKTLTNTAKQCLRRFPITVGFVIALTVYSLATIWSEKGLFPEKVDETICYYFSVGALLTTVLQLWGEETSNRRMRIAVNTVAHIALLADTAYLYSIYGHYSMEVVLAHAAVITSLALCMFIIPFLREKDDIASWNFSLRIFALGASSWLVGLIMFGGIELLTTAIEQLFNVTLSGRWFSTWAILCLWTLPLTLFVGRIPADEEKHDRTPLVFTFLHKSIHYLFLPLLGCYLTVLYCYLAKILIEWQLPDGWVSKLVSALTFGCIGVVLGLYPSLHKGESVTDKRIVRFLPLAILPLLALMTVGIIRRFDDYGVTVNRLYLLTLNIWFYIVCIGLAVSRARRIRWIAVSFATLFILTSALPINITQFSRNWIYGRVKERIKRSYKGKLPMDENLYYDWITALPTEEAKLINSRLRYLDSEVGYKDNVRLIKQSVNWWQAEEYITSKDDVKSRYYYYSSHSTSSGVEVKLDAKYASMLVYTDVQAKVKISTSKTIQVPIYKDEQSMDTLEVRIEDLRKWNCMGSYTPHNIPCRHKGHRFVLTSFTLQNWADSTASFTYSGYYLMTSTAGR